MLGRVLEREPLGDKRTATVRFLNRAVRSRKTDAQGQRWSVRSFTARAFMKGGVGATARDRQDVAEDPHLDARRPQDLPKGNSAAFMRCNTGA